MKLTKIAKLLLTACFGLFSFVAIAQNKTVTGKVTDEKGMPVAGVSVTAKGSKGGTSTSADGTYTLSVPASAANLVFSSVGFGKKEAAIAGSSVNVSLTATNDNLNEVVVIGYGTAKKKDLTGAVAIVSAKNFNPSAAAGPDQLIQGKVSGVSIMSNTGQPGAETTVRIRGYSTLRADDGQPLYVIDGVPYDGRTARPGLNALGLGETPNTDPLMFINSSDIASMQILKDASACAIYGSRAANGVVMIETKKGSGSPKIEFNYSIGTSKVAKKWGILDAAGYKEALAKYSMTTTETGNADAQEAVFRNGKSENVNVAFSGGNEKSNFRLSLGYSGIEGVIKNSDLKKYMFGLLGSTKMLNDRLTVDYNIKIANVTENIVATSTADGATSTLIGNMLRWHPLKNFVKTDGSWNQPSGEINPVALLDAYKDKASLMLGSGQLGLKYNISDEFDFKVLGSVSSQSGIRKTSVRSFLDAPSILDRGWASIANRTMITNFFNSYLTYKKELSKSVKMDAMLGYEYYKTDVFGNNQSGQDFKDIPTYLNYYDVMGYASSSSLRTSSYKDISWELQSYFGRANFNIKDKYLLTATLRADGSSKFGSNNKYAYFPSFAFGWNMSNEDFMKNVNCVKNIKLRLGYGLTGSQGVPPGASLPQYSLTQQGSINSTPGNLNLRWESEKQFNIGADFTLLNGRLIGTIDYYNKNRKNLLFINSVQLPGPNATFYDNLPTGNIINSGVEIALNYDVIKNKDWNWNLGFNTTFQKNELKNYDGRNILTGVLSGPGTSGTRVQKLIEGKPINAFYTREFLGYDASGQAIYTGGADETRVNTGSPIPNTLLGINTSVSYKEFTLTASGYGMFGHMIYNNTANGFTSLGNLGKNNVDSKYIGTGEAPGNAPKASSKYLEKGNFFRMGNITVSYNIGAIAKWIKGANVYVTGNNLFVITKYTGFDPEVNVSKPDNGAASQGIDYLAYPSARSFRIGFNLTF